MTLPQASAEPCWTSHQRRRTKHDLTSGCDRVAAQPCLTGGRDTSACQPSQAPTGLGAAAYVGAVVLYILIALVAVVPGMVADIGVLARTLRVEAVLQTVLVFLGVNVDWSLLFDQAQPRSAFEDLQPPRGR